MKALRYLLMVCVTVGFLSVNAQNLSRDWGKAPKSEMRSTSAMVGSGTSLPFAAQSGVSFAYTPASEPTKYYIPGGPRRTVGGNDPDDDDGDGWADDDGDDPDKKEDEPFPIGDGALPLAILACVYAIYRVRRRIRGR